MDRRWWTAAATAAATAATAAAASWLSGCPPRLTGCIVGESRACACTNGLTGAQVCLEDGTLGPCTCDGPGTDAGDGADGGLPGQLTFSFSGALTQVDDVAGVSGASCGTPFSGSYTYSTMVTDSNVDPTVGDYSYAATPNGITVTIAGIVYETDPVAVDVLLEVLDGVPPSEDSYLLRSNNNRSSLASAYVDTIAWQLDDLSGAALSSDALPTVPPDLAAYTQGAGFTVLACGTPDGTGACVVGGPDTFFLRGVVDTVGP
ncbi:MAG TPA: hypothetical protein VG389_06600 [Myxococcota bacterium]|jgi:hypothetical protein|nr:hypothetical protein [Myxococcota bacterium]